MEKAEEMGNLFSSAKATNEINSMISAAMTVANSVSQKCNSTATQNQVITLRDIHGNVYLHNLDFDQIIIVDSNCSTSAELKTQLQAAVQQELVQKANALVEALSLGSAEANNLVNAAIDLSQNITNSFTQACSPGTNQTEEILIADVKGNVELAYLNFKQLADITTHCVQNAVSDSKAALDIKQIIDQSAVAKAEGLLSFLKWGAIILVVIVVIVVIIVVVVLFGKKGGGKNKTQITVTK